MYCILYNIYISIFQNFKIQNQNSKFKIKIKMKLLILPHQLFKIDYIKDAFKDVDESIDSIVLYEHPQYFKKYKFNKKKLLYTELL